MFFFSRLSISKGLLLLLLPALSYGQKPIGGVEANATLPKLALVPIERNDDALTPFEKSELRRLFGLDLRELARRPVHGVLGYEQEYWRNPASVHVLRPDDVSLNGHVLTVEAFRGVPGMHVTRGLGYDDFAIMRNFSGTSTAKFLAMVDGREVLQIMGGTVNATGEGVPLEILDRVEIIRGPGASIWGTNAVSGVYNVVTKSAVATQGDSVRLVIRDDGTFLGDYVHGGQAGKDAFYRVWFRDQEYAEGTLNSGLSAKDDGYFRKLGFRYDKTLSRDLDFTFAGALGKRRVHHVLDLSQRLYYPTEPATPVDAALLQGLPGAVGVPITWPPSRDSDLSMPPGFTRYEYWGEMPHDAGHLRAKLSGVTDSDLEWTLAGYAEQYKTFLGHVGRRWERKEYDLDFKANKPIGDRHHLSFGFGARHMDFDIEDVVTPPWDFPTIDTIFFLEEADKNGYQEVHSPIVVNAASAMATGQLPDKEGQMYVDQNEGMYLIPTAEVPVTNFFRDEILNSDELPVKRCAYTPCFRREAGSWGKDVRGLNRLHQFDKVELVKWVHPDNSFDELESLRKDAEGLLQKLGLPYRVLLICSGDIGFPHSKQYDLDVWAAGQKRWLEVSSCSNFTDFQARRANIRFRGEDGKPQPVHTLNGSALAIPRVLAAILENNLDSEGRVKVPDCLRTWFDKDFLSG